jgi:hypothetical protein
VEAPVIYAIRRSAGVAFRIPAFQIWLNCQFQHRESGSSFADRACRAEIPLSPHKSPSKYLLRT